MMAGKEMKLSRNFKRYVLAQAPWWIITKHRKFIDGEYGVMELHYILKQKANSDKRLVIGIWSIASLLIGIMGGLLIAILVD